MLRVCVLTLCVFAVLPDVHSNDMMDPRSYFKIQGIQDMTEVTWVHRCNSRKQLERALASDVMMIEADIIAGHLEGDTGGPPIPVMGHPPVNIGDLSLEQFLDQVLREGRGKGIKLDFKSSDIFKASENVLEQFLLKPEVDFPVWVNADIVRGPGIPDGNEVVEPNYFLHTCVNKFPQATVSAGWKVNAANAQNLRYNSSYIDEMTTLLAHNRVVHPVTFPVHCGIASNSIETLTSLVHSSVEGTTLTLWCGDGEWVDYDKLRTLIENVGKDKVFLDLPVRMKTQLLHPPLPLGASGPPSSFMACSLALLLWAFLCSH